jgi:hypothetical protein
MQNLWSQIIRPDTNQIGLPDSLDLFEEKIGDGDWIRKAALMYTAPGVARVGIGTTVPKAKLDINGDLRVTNSGDGAVLFNLNSERSWEFQQLGTGAGTALKLKSVGGGGNKNFVIETDGNVGIGTTNPDKSLTVRGEGDDGKYDTVVNTFENRFVALYRARTSNRIEVRTTSDGVNWTLLGHIRNSNNVAVRAASAPGLFWDGTFYHAVWFDSTRDLWYAVSRDAKNWLVESNPSGRYRGGQPAIAVGRGKIIVAFQGLNNNIHVLNLNSGNPHPPVVAQSRMNPGLTFGNGYFVLTYAKESDRRVHIKRSSNGRDFTEMPNTVGGSGRPPSVTFSNETFYLLARGGSNPRGFIHSSTDGHAWRNDGPVVKTWVGDVTHTAIARSDSKLLVLESRGGILDAHVFEQGNTLSNPSRLSWSTAASGIAVAFGRVLVRTEMSRPRLRHTQWQGEFGKTDAGRVLLGSFENQPALQGHGTGTSYKLLLNPYGGNVGIGTNNPQGRLDVNGKIFQRSVERHPEYVFEPEHTLETIEEHATFMWNNRHLKAVHKPENDENGNYVIEIGAQQRGILEELEKAHIYIEQLHKRLSLLEKDLTELKKKQSH